MPECSILPLRGRLADPSHGECTWLQIGWGIVIFVVNVFFLKIFVTITSRSERLLADLAKHDPLTGLYNRAGYGADDCRGRPERADAAAGGC